MNLFNTILQSHLKFSQQIIYCQLQLYLFVFHHNPRFDVNLVIERFFVA